MYWTTTPRIPYLDWEVTRLSRDRFLKPRRKPLFLHASIVFFPGIVIPISGSLRSTAIWRESLSRPLRHKWGYERILGARAWKRKKGEITERWCCKIDWIRAIDRLEAPQRRWHSGRIRRTDFESSSWLVVVFAILYRTGSEFLFGRVGRSLRRMLQLFPDFVP